MTTWIRAVTVATCFGLGTLACSNSRAQLDLKDPVDAFPGIPPAGTLKGHEKFVRGVAFSPDGKLIATAGEDVAILWNSTTGKVVHRLAPKDKPTGAYSVAFAPDGKTLAVGGYLGDVFFWDTKTGTQSGMFDEPSLAVLKLAYSPDGSLLAASHDQASVMLYDVKAAKLAGTLKPSKGNIQSFALSNDGKLLTAISREELTFWDIAAQKMKKGVALDSQDPSASFGALACSPASPVAAVTGGKILEQKTVFYDLKTLRPTGELVTDNAEPSLQTLAFSPDGKVLASGPGGGIMNRTPISLWNVASGERFAALVGPSEGVSQVAFSADGRRVAASSLDKLVRVWNLPAGGAKAKAQAKGKAKAKGKMKAKKSAR
jgi:WD40 repeat protein